MEKEKLFEGLEKNDLEKLINMSDCAMFITSQDPDIKLLFANEKFYSILQYSQKEFKEEFANQVMQVIVPEEVQKIKSLIARQSAAGGQLHLEFRITRKDGAIHWMSMTARSIVSEQQLFYFCSCFDITQQKRNINDIYNAKREVELITNSIPGGVIKIKPCDYSLLYANDGFYRLAGYSRTEYFSLFGNKCSHVIHPDDKTMVQNLIQAAVQNSGVLGFEYRIVSKSGDVRWSYINGRRVDDDRDGNAVYLCIIMDITARKKLEEKISDNIERSEFLLNYMKETEWTYRIDEKKIYRNGFLKETYSSESEIDRIFEEEFLKNCVHPEDMGILQEQILLREQMTGEGRGVYRIKDAKGNYRPFEVNMISIAETGNGKPNKIYGETRLLDDHSFMIVKEDKESGKSENIAEKILDRAKTAQQKYEDKVTDLMPVHIFLHMAEEMLNQRSEEDKYAIICCDINKFQKLCYHYGISIGNELLKKLSTILRDNLSYNNLCSRVSGDYFIMLVKYQGHSQLLRLMSFALHVLSEYEEGQTFLTYGTTSGIYLVQPEDTSLDEMLQKADYARRSIKGTRGNHYAIYTEELEKNRFLEDEMIQDIGEAMMNHSVEVCYLPRIQGDRENVIGSKAVPRIQLKDSSYLSLEDLRRYIDRDKEVQQMVFYVLANVCCNMSAWKASGKKIMPVSIDITAGQLCMQNAVNKIEEIVKTNKIDPEYIIFEIQEHYFREVGSDLQMALERLHKMGFRIMISRFGSEHTALHSVRRLPITGIKFHAEFFRQNQANEKDAIVFRNVVGMAHELGLEVYCGGINTKLQEDIASSIGCDILEGGIYYGAVRNDVYEKCFLTEE